MKENKDNCLNDAQKLLVAMGAAMGGGCRICAENLHKLAGEQGSSRADILKACQLGLEAKAEAINTMKAKVSEILKDTQPSEAKNHSKDMKKIITLIRTAAFTAANSSPDAFKEIRKAFAQGISKGDIRTCISIARMVREKAATFSDKEVAEQTCCCTSESPEANNKAANDQSDTTPPCSCEC